MTSVEKVHEEEKRPITTQHYIIFIASIIYLLAFIIVYWKSMSTEEDPGNSTMSFLMFIITCLIISLATMLALYVTSCLLYGKCHVYSWILSLANLLFSIMIMMSIIFSYNE